MVKGCFGTKEFSERSTICKNCDIRVECKVVRCKKINPFNPKAVDFLMQ